MKNRFYQVLGMAIIGLMLTVSPTLATTIVGGIAFDDNAFADTVLASYGTWTLVSAPNLQAALVGPDLTGYAYNINSPTSYVKMGFTDNFLVNGSGVDLAVFEVSGSGSPGATGCSVTLSLTKNSTKITKTPIWTNAVYYVAKYDLSEFGVASGGLISDFFIWGNSGDPEYTVFGAMNNTNVVPVPGSLMLLGSGLVAVAGLKPWRSRNLR